MLPNLHNLKKCFEIVKIFKNNCKSLKKIKIKQNLENVFKLLKSNQMLANL